MIIKVKTRFILLFSKNIIRGNVRNNLDIVKIFGIFGFNFLILFFNKMFFIQINHILQFYYVLGFNKILNIINITSIEESLYFILLKNLGYLNAAS